jgi:hypothetical protein
MTIERCDKCGKSFMNKSEVERHKRWEHPVPVSPFEEQVAQSTTNTNEINAEDLQKLTTDVKAGSSASDTNTIIGGSGQRRRVPFRPFRV